MYRHIEAYSHQSRIGVLVELETADDFTANTDEFRKFARDIALHITAMNPIGIEPIDKSNLVHLWSHSDDNEMSDAILLNQPFIKDPDKTIKEYLKEVESKLSTKIKIMRFVRFANDET